MAYGQSLERSHLPSSEWFASNSCAQSNYECRENACHPAPRPDGRRASEPDYLPNSNRAVWTVPSFSVSENCSQEPGA